MVFSCAQVVSYVLLHKENGLPEEYFGSCDMNGVVRLQGNNGGPALEGMIPHNLEIGGRIIFRKRAVWNRRCLIIPWRRAPTTWTCTLKAPQHHMPPSMYTPTNQSNPIIPSTMRIES